MKNSKIAIFASGSGTNAENIIRFFNDHPTISVDLVLTNNENAGVINRAKSLGIENVIFTKEEFRKMTGMLALLRNIGITHVVLAGFLWLIPKSLIEAFPDRIINIHPALLPKYGGKGMYGMNVHKAVIENKEAFSGISIHYVNEKYDEGSIIFQAKCPVSSSDTPETLAGKIHKLEYEHFPRIIESVIEAS